MPQAGGEGEANDRLAGRLTWAVAVRGAQDWTTSRSPSGAALSAISPPTVGLSRSHRSWTSARAAARVKKLADLPVRLYDALFSERPEDESERLVQRLDVTHLYFSQGVSLCGVWGIWASRNLENARAPESAKFGI